MGSIILKNAFFGYDMSSQKYVLENINLNIDTSWKLGVLGKNGSGKTTLLHMILNSSTNKGEISSSEECIYFPIEEFNTFKGNVREFYESVVYDLEDWKVYIEFEQMGLDYSILDKMCQELSEGEKCKVQLVALFLDQYKFPLIDEPTNNLDLVGRQMVGNYLQQKLGFIISSHDEKFLNGFITHVVSIEDRKASLVHGNVTTFKIERDKQLKQLNTNQEKLKKEIMHLSNVSNTFRDWANKREKETKDASSRRIAAKQMKRAKAVEKRTEIKIKEKELLIKPITNERLLKINTINNDKKMTYLKLEEYTLFLKNGNEFLFSPINMNLDTHDVIWIKGRNGIGKTTFLKNLINEQQNMKEGVITNKVNSVSYLSQKILSIEDIYKKIMVLDRQAKEMFYFNMNLIGVKMKASTFSSTDNWSMGELKKIMIALSLVIPSKVFIWDELSNFLDMETIDKIIHAVITYKPTVLFVDHNEYFGESIATKIVKLN